MPVEDPGGHRPQEHLPARARIWKRPIVWIGTIITAMFLAIATAFGTGAGQSLYTTIFGNHSASGPPVTIDSVMYETAQGASTAAFSQVLNPRQIAPMNQGNNFQEFMDHVTGAGGAIILDAAIQIVLTGNAGGTSVIAGMQVVKHCTAPLSGTLLYAPGAAVDTNVEVGFNLDAGFPTAQNYRVEELSGNFFTEHTISLRHGETQTLLVHAITSQQYCQFTFQLIVDTAGKQVTEVIDNHGAPFVVTALTRLSDYHALYVGGVADFNPRNHGDFMSVNLATLRKSMGLP